MLLLAETIPRQLWKEDSDLSATYDALRPSETLVEALDIIETKTRANNWNVPKESCGRVNVSKEQSALPLNVFQG